MKTGALALAATVVTGSAWAASVEVVVDGGDASPGRVYVTLCQGGLSGGACRIGDSAPGGGGTQRFRFDGVSPGFWAVAAYQDLNGNGQLDRTQLGLPLEPYGLSNGAGRRTRPDFASARFSLGDPGATIRVHLIRALGRR